MSNYRNGKIYAIRSHQTDDVYIGSTTQSLSQRLGGHVKKFNCYKRGTNIGKANSFKILEYDDYYIELIEDYPCDRVEQLTRREGQIMRDTPNIINDRIAGRTRKEYRDENKKEISERKKVDWNKNKARYTVRAKKYREKHKEILKSKKAIYIENNREKVAERKHIWYINNRERILEKQKSKYINNRERILEKQKSKIVQTICECGGTYTNRKARHEQTQKHQKYLTASFVVK